jgi:uncharacterized membrane protein YsdA (DUF1294 family)
MEIFIIYLILVNSVAFFLSFFDKRAAIHHKRRVPERTLFISAGIGGSIGLYLSMMLFRHKTKHLSFTLGVPAIICVQLFSAWFLLRP